MLKTNGRIPSTVIFLYVFTIGILKDNAWYGSAFSFIVFGVIWYLNISNVI
jgi:hypothetical protein